MALLSNPNLAYVLVVVSVTLIFLSNMSAYKLRLLNIGMALSFIAALLAFLFLRINPWAFVAVALSPFAFASALRQNKPQNLLLMSSIFVLAIAPFFLFVDQDGEPAVSTNWAWVSVLSATILWLSTERLRNVDGARLSDAANSVVGQIGETITDIELHAAGSVLVDGEIWQARSEKAIPAGSTVRVIRKDGFFLTVKKAERLSKQE